MVAQVVQVAPELGSVPQLVCCSRELRVCFGHARYNSSSGAVACGYVSAPRASSWSAQTSTQRRGWLLNAVSLFSLCIYVCWLLGRCLVASDVLFFRAFTLLLFCLALRSTRLVCQQVIRKAGGHIVAGFRSIHSPFCEGADVLFWRSVSPHLDQKRKN